MLIMAYYILIEMIHYTEKWKDMCSRWAVSLSTRWMFGILSALELLLQYPSHSHIAYRILNCFHCRCALNSVMVYDDGFIWNKRNIGYEVFGCVHSYDVYSVSPSLPISLSKAYKSKNAPYRMSHRNYTHIGRQAAFCENISRIQSTFTYTIYS